ncbi:tetratricopeptide repeat protein [Mariniflexile fucanivorans]|uniref:Tetratricopeptide repeat protein n=1 Tax=Mariniflexile fucanivorans TaxID=264023 RepID=A0A4R1RMP3_9FLAO|nr:tetratricopeptide repeat protein [Mariniflexile fucanivorans]TCL67072.1 tetratricopeptide repeat protein [Mariniflexile fucanivorans]
MKDNSNISQEIFEAIERYINGTMEPSELKDFKDYLKIDAEFKSQVKDYRIIIQGVKNQSLKEELNTFHDEIIKSEIPKAALKKARYLFISKIAAMAAIIVAIGSIWFFSSSPNQKIYANYFKPYPGLTATMSDTENLDFYDAMVYYKQKKYDLAIEKWQVLSNKKPDNDTLNYFLGIAYMANKNVDKAIPLLQKTIETSHSGFSFIYDAYYYLGLAYLKEGDINLAKKYLTLSNTNISKEIILELPN